MWCLEPIGWDCPDLLSGHSVYTTGPGPLVTAAPTQTEQDQPDWSQLAWMWVMWASPGLFIIPVETHNKIVAAFPTNICPDIWKISSWSVSSADAECVDTIIDCCLSSAAIILQKNVCCSLLGWFLSSPFHIGLRWSILHCVTVPKCSILAHCAFSYLSLFPQRILVLENQNPQGKKDTR